MASTHRWVFREGAISLNDEQDLIVRQPPTANMRILASAGSGKTTTLTARIAYLLTHADAIPAQIILITFTHNAAAVMRQRLEALMGHQRILCGTFHALSQQILRDHAPAALNDLYHVDELPLKALDWLATPTGRAWVRTLRWIFIDEFQDINDTQYQFIRALHHPEARVTIVGDDAQNIYSWRGSCVDYILNFHKQFAGVADFQLATNYRSAASIVAVANSIMRHIPTLDHKSLMTAAPTASVGDRPSVLFFARTAEERDWVCEAAVAALEAGGTTVILSKFNSVLYAYEATLLKMGVRVRFVAGDHTETHASRTVFLATFHGSKGLEWDNVFLVRMNDEVFPQQKDEDNVLQERRLFYVAVTRARRTLTFTYSRQERSLSRFVREIHRPLLSWPGLPRYELSTVAGQITPVSVREWVGYLSGEDYRTIKQLAVLPTALRDPTILLSAAPAQQQHVTTVRDQYIVPYWWVEQGMVTEFFDFLRAFWLREIGVLRPESGGQWDREAQQIIWTVKIAAEDAALFEARRPMFEELAQRFFGATARGEAPPQIYYTEILAAMGPAAAEMSQPDVIRTIQIIHKMRTMLYNLRFANIAFADLQFAPIRHTPPQETRCQLIEAWRSYTNGSPLPATPTFEQLLPIYLVGLCRALAEGRSGVLASLPGEREWSQCREFLAAFRQKAATTVATAKTVLCRVTAEVVPGVTAAADMIVGDTAWFFVGGDQPSELQRLERMVMVLLTVHALRIAGHRVHRVCLFQMLTGQQIGWSVDDWPPTTASLLTAFVQARVQHVATAANIV
jgi:hypothetical protein